MSATKGLDPERHLRMSEARKSTGYLTRQGLMCFVVAPSLILRKPGSAATNRNDEERKGDVRT